MKRTLQITIITLVIIFGIYSVVNAADSLDELRQKRQEIQNEINSANSNIENIEIERTESLEAINKLDNQISAYEIELANITEELDEIQQEVNVTKEKLTNMEKTYKEQKDILEKRLIALYEAGDTSYLDVLLNSKSVVDFISNYYLIGEIMDYDNTLLESIGKEKDKIENISLILEEKQTRLTETKKNQEKSIIALENARVVRNSRVKELSEEEQNLQTQIDTYKQELDKIDSQVLLLTAGSISPDYAGGALAWPAPRIYNDYI